MFYTQVCKYYLHANIRRIYWALLWIGWNIYVLHVYVTSHVIKMCQKKKWLTMYCYCVYNIDMCKKYRLKHFGKSVSCRVPDARHVKTYIVITIINYHQKLWFVTTIIRKRNYLKMNIIQLCTTYCTHIFWIRLYLRFLENELGEE